MSKRASLLIPVICLVPIALIVYVALRSGSSAGPPVRFWGVSFSPDGQTLATVGGPSDPEEVPHNGELVLWDLGSRKEKQVFQQESTIRSVAWSSDGTVVAIGDFSGRTRLFDARTWKNVVQLTPRNELVNAVVISADNKVVASGSFDGTVKLWDVEGKELDTLRVNNERILNVAMSPDHRTLVATCQNGKSYLFHLEGGQSPQILDSYQGSSVDTLRVEAVAFRPNGHSFVTGCLKTLRLWDADTGKLVRDFRGSTGNVNSAAFSPDGKTLATVDSDGTLVLWSPATGERLNVTSAHTGISFGVAFSPDGKRLATVGRDDLRVRIWDAKDLTLLSTLRRGNAIKGIGF